MTKLCSSCKELKPVLSFHKRSISPDGLTASCKSCRSTARKSYKSQKVYNKAYREKNREVLLKSKKEWDASNRQHINAYKRDYRKEHPTKHSEWDAKKRASRLQRVPKWLNSEQKEAIKQFYWLRDDIIAITGELYEVDHIIPLQGKNVCGLHVPWNLQILPSDLNNKKSNIFKQGFSGNVA
jgi:hypothetical protein